MAPTRQPTSEPKRHPLLVAGAVLLILLLAGAVYVAIQKGYSSKAENPPGGQPAGTTAPEKTETPESAKPLQNRDSGGLGKGGLGQ